MPVRFRVIVDEREKPSGVHDLLKEFGLQVEHRILDVDDYVVSPECAIERKKGQDFLRSLYSGRLFDQAHRLSEAYDHPVLILVLKINKEKDYVIERLRRGMSH